MDNEEDISKDSIEKKLEEIRKNRLDQDERVEKLHLQFRNQIDSNTLDMPVFISEIDSLDESTRNHLLERLINNRNPPSVLKNQSLFSITTLIDYLNINNYFEHSNYTRPHEYVEFLSASGHKHEILMYLFKNTSVLSISAAQKLAQTEKGIDELIDVIKNNEGSQLSLNAIRVLANELVHGYEFASSIDSYWPSSNKQASPKIVGLLRDFVNSSEHQIGLAASQSLFYARELSRENIEFLLKTKNSQQKILGLAVFRHYDIDAKTIGQFMPIIIELLEDERTDVSQGALNTVEALSPTYPSELSENIIELLILRSTKRPQEFFNINITVSALKETFKHNPRLHGQTLHKLRDIAFNSDGNDRTRAVFVGTAISKKEFLALVDEIKASNPKTANSIADIVSGSLERAQIVADISETDPKDVQQNAANQIKLLSEYHEDGLRQAKLAFFWAIALTLLSFSLLIALAVYIVTIKLDSLTSIITAISSLLVQFIAGTLFYLYNQTRKQLTYYHRQMNQTQRFLLANSVAESLDKQARETARIELIKVIAANENVTIEDKDAPN